MWLCTLAHALCMYLILCTLVSAVVSESEASRTFKESLDERSGQYWEMVQRSRWDIYITGCIVSGIVSLAYFAHSSYTTPSSWQENCRLVCSANVVYFVGVLSWYLLQEKPLQMKYVLQSERQMHLWEEFQGSMRNGMRRALMVSLAIAVHPLLVGKII